MQECKTEGLDIVVFDSEIFSASVSYSDHCTGRRCGLLKRFQKMLAEEVRPDSIVFNGHILAVMAFPCVRCWPECYVMMRLI